MTIEDVVSRFEAKKKGNRWQAKCPAHPDNVASLSIKEGDDGKTLLYCHAGCSTSSILGAVGLKQEDLFPKQDATTPPTYYVYTDCYGKPAFRKVRKFPKAFFIERMGEESSWVSGINGATPELYNIVNVLEAVKKGTPIWLVEGEKDADAFIKRGQVATTSILGAGKWNPKWSESLKGGKVVIVADKDEPGLKHAKMVEELLNANVKIVEAKEGKDAHDHFSFGHSLKDFVPVRSAVEVFEGVDPGDIEPENISFYWNPYIPQGKAVLLDGDSGTRKTTLLLALFAAFSNGVDVVRGNKLEPARALYFGKEDSPGEMAQIYQAHSGKKGFCKIVPECFSLTPKKVEAVRREIERGGWNFCAFDSFIYFLEGIVKDNNTSVQEIQSIISDLRDVYRETNCTGIHIRHTGKSVLGKSTEALGVGSYQFRASHRGQILVRKFPLKEQWRHCYVTDEKGSMLAELGEPFAFERVGNELRFYIPDSDPFTEERGRGRPDERLEAAKEMLKKEMVGGVPRFAADILAFSEGYGISADTIRRAAKSLTVKMERGAEGRWLWTLPDPFDDGAPWADLD